MFNNTPPPPYYAVIFTSKRSPEDNGYGAMSAEMEQLVRQQSGFLGMDSVRDERGWGMTVCYWANKQSIDNWAENTRHMEAKAKGMAEWYENYTVRICKVEQAY